MFYNQLPAVGEHLGEWQQEELPSPGGEDRTCISRGEVTLEQQ